MLLASPLPTIRAYDLSGFYIVCTSNIGSQQLLRPTRLPFTTLERAVIAELHRFFRPELIGRFDEKIVFRPLLPEIQREIDHLAICQELDRLSEQGFSLTVSEAAFEFLVRRRIQKTLGARPLDIDRLDLIGGQPSLDFPSDKLGTIVTPQVGGRSVLGDGPPDPF